MMEADPAFSAPALFVLFFVMAAMALVVAPISWIYKSCSAHPPAHDLRREVLIFQFRNLAGVLFLSLLVNVWHVLSEGTGGVLQFMPEALLLAFLIWRFLVHTRGEPEQPKHRVLREGARVTGQFALCLIGWGLTLLAGFLFYMGLLAVSGGDRVAAATGAGFITGAAWIGVVAGAFFLFKARASDPAAVMPGVRFYDLLWPVMLAYVALLFPLMVQDIGNSEKFYEMLHSKRPPRRI